MEKLEGIAERIHENFSTRTAVRDQALSQARRLTRESANAIRAVHRDEYDVAHEHLTKARKLVDSLNKNLINHPDLYFAGYTQDAIKEFAEANLTHALIRNQYLPTPEELGVQFDTYLKGLAESVGELRRRCLDILRHGHSEEAERLLGHMDEIFSILVTMDYPDAITGGLRRLTDIVRGITERTRGDLTMSLRQQKLEQQLLAMERHLNQIAN
jgi:translin